MLRCCFIMAPPATYALALSVRRKIPHEAHQNRSLKAAAPCRSSLSYPPPLPLPPEHFVPTLLPGELHWAYSSGHVHGSFPRQGKDGRRSQCRSPADCSLCVYGNERPRDITRLSAVFGADGDRDSGSCDGGSERGGRGGSVVCDRSSRRGGAHAGPGGYACGGGDAATAASGGVTLAPRGNRRRRAATYNSPLPAPPTTAVPAAAAPGALLLRARRRLILLLHYHLCSNCYQRRKKRRE